MSKRKYKLYYWETEFDFGKNKGKTVKQVFEESPSYINWCFQKVDWFCITDEMFDKLPIVTFLRSKEIDGDDWLKILTDIHSEKNEFLKNNKVHEFNYNEPNFEDGRISDEKPYMSGDPRYDRGENPWIDVFGEGEEAEAAYWNTH